MGFVGIIGWCYKGEEDEKDERLKINNTHYFISHTRTKYREGSMLYYALIFLVIALLAGALGIWALAGVAATIAKILFFVFLVLFLIGLFSGRKP